MLQYSVSKCVFSRLLKLSLPRSGSFKLSGRRFQSDGPAAEKASGPSAQSRHRGITNKRRVADRRCCRVETSDTGIQRSVRNRSRMHMTVQAPSTKTTTFWVFNSVIYSYPCITLVLNSIRISPWVFPFLGFLEPYSVFLKDYLRDPND